jgi:hypothetical protein
MLGCNNDQYVHPNITFFKDIEVQDIVTINIDSTYRAYSNETLTTLFDRKQKIELENISSEIKDIQFLDIQTATLGEKYIYVVSEGINSVFVYNFEGELVFRLGRNGNGPGEFTNIKNISVDERNGFLYVLENNEIEIFRYRSNGYEHLKKKILTNVSNYDLCSFGNKVYLVGIDIEKESINQTITTSDLIKVYDQSLDSVISQFGKPYKSYSENPVLDALLSKGKLLCNEKRGSISYLFSDFGYEVEFGKNWEPKILYAFKGFSPRKLKENNVDQPKNASITYLDEGKINVFASAFSYKNYSIYQIGNMSMANNLKDILSKNKFNESNIPKPKTIIIDTETKEIYSNNSINYRILSISSRGALIVVYNKVSEGIYEPTVYLQANK